MKDLDLQELPPLVYQLLLLSTKVSSINVPFSNTSEALLRTLLLAVALLMASLTKPCLNSHANSHSRKWPPIHYTATE